ncbi:hypothetical protein GGI25_004441 [Coemansia spiralis]|uniref:Uncharacterized protein n=2 Tax=Coemansia TaxID=4863 RepID=A0A9W8G5I5_9FUNG|nr:hypothetical protein EDC05_004164 [Coemansia umbellata]KAJ2618712.1 hypothetical protein GGI26_006404 [Coemansia sp. RSA 1358]KAJ2674148.1 hypothetical protein GGI25_004441 [Coemansia spiralis]
MTAYFRSILRAKRPYGLVRRYTNTSVYTRGDAMTHEEHLKALLEEQRYLIELLKTDDSKAPWQQKHIDTVSRGVQHNSIVPRTWVPEDAFHN